MQWTRGYTPQPSRVHLYNQALVVTILGNIVLAVSKAVVAYYSHSVAVYADAANSASDVLYSLLMVLGLWMAQRPPDISHPQGHSRFEPVIGLVISASMAFAGFEAARTSLLRFEEGGLAVDPGLPTLVLLFSAVTKAGMYAFIRRVAMQLGSPALSASARDNLSDVLTSTAALVGAAGSRFIHPLLDPIAGFLVAAWIFRGVYRAGKENLGYLTGAGASAELREQIAQVAQDTPGVRQVHHIMTEYAGPRLIVDIHINVDGSITLNEAHAIEDNVAARLEELAEVDRAYVHTEPMGWSGSR